MTSRSRKKLPWIKDDVPAGEGTLRGGAGWSAPGRGSFRSPGSGQTLPTAAKLAKRRREPRFSVSPFRVLGWELPLRLLGALRLCNTLCAVICSFGLRAAVSRRLAYARLSADSVPHCSAAISLFAALALRLGGWSPEAFFVAFSPANPLWKTPGRTARKRQVFPVENSLKKRCYI